MSNLLDFLDELEAEIPPKKKRKTPLEEGQTVIWVNGQPKELKEATNDEVKQWADRAFPGIEANKLTIKTIADRQKVFDFVVYLHQKFVLSIPAAQ